MTTPPTLHPSGVGEILDGAIYVYRKNFLTLIGISAVIAVPFLLLQSAAAFVNAPIDPFFVGQLSRTNFNASALSFVFVALYLLIGLLRAIAGVFETGALAFAIAERRMGRTVTIGRAYRQALGRWTALLGAAFLVQVISFAGLSLLVVPFLVTMFASLLAPGNAALLLGSTLLSCVSVLAVVPALFLVVYLTVRWSLTAPAIVLENLGALKGMGRSWRLVHRSFWRMLFALIVIWALVGLITYVVALGVQFGAAALLRGSVVLMTIFSTVGTVIASTLFQPLQAAVVTLLYYDLRVRKEGYDLQLALDQLKQALPAASLGSVS